VTAHASPCPTGDDLLRQCIRGFDNEFHWANWLAKHRPTIDALPPEWRSDVLQCHDQAGPREGVRRTAPEVEVPRGDP
jgi:hypothetical protein